MLTVADLEINVFEFRQRAFSFARVVPVGGEEYAVFTRTETESESRFRPALVHLSVVVPLAWVVHDEASDTLRIGRDGAPPAPALTEPVLEVGAEPTEFGEQGVRWKRAQAPTGTLVYVPAERAEALLAPGTLATLAGA